MYIDLSQITKEVSVECPSCHGELQGYFDCQSTWGCIGGQILLSQALNYLLKVTANMQIHFEDSTERNLWFQ